MMVDLEAKEIELLVGIMKSRLRKKTREYADPRALAKRQERCIEPYGPRRDLDLWQIEKTRGLILKFEALTAP